MPDTIDEVSCAAGLRLCAEVETWLEGGPVDPVAGIQKCIDLSRRMRVGIRWWQIRARLESWLHIRRLEGYLAEARRKVTRAE